MQKGLLHPLFVSVDEVLLKPEPGVLICHHTPRRRASSPQSNAGGISYWWPGPSPAEQSGGVVIPEALLALPRRFEQMNRDISAVDFLMKDYGEGPFTRLFSLADDHASQNKKHYEAWCRLLVLTGFFFGADRPAGHLGSGLLVGVAVGGLPA